MNYNKLEKLEPSFICSNKCWGVDNYDGSCCTIENRDFIIGPHPDADEFVERLSLKFGKQFKKENVYILELIPMIIPLFRRTKRNAILALSLACALKTDWILLLMPLFN